MGYGKHVFATDDSTAFCTVATLVH